MKEYKVVYIDFPSPSFKWANGLHFVYSDDGVTLEIGKLNQDGTIKYFEDGLPMLSVTGSSNPGIVETNLFIRF